MKITIELDESYAKILSQWASVSRTLNTAKQMCNHIVDNDDLDSTLREKANWCQLELDCIEPALNYLHQLVRQEIWKQNQDINKK